jgi:tellurite resistance protein
MTVIQRYVPLSFFSMAVGTLAWSHAWQAAAVAWMLPSWLPLSASLIGLGLWASLCLAYLKKWREQPLAAQEEFHHPVQSVMASLVPVSTMLAALSLKPYAPAVAQVLWVAGLCGQAALGVWLGGRLWQGGRTATPVTAALYLPAVAQNFVAATTSAAFGMPALGGLFFGAGVLSWLALESVILQRAAHDAELEMSLRPLQGIQVAPAAVGGLSYLALTDGPPDLVAHMLLGYALYQALIAARLLPWTARIGLTPAYWAFSFGVMAMATMSLRMLARAPQEPLWQILAPLLFALANVTLLALLTTTVALIRQGRLLPAPGTPSAEKLVGSR